MYSQATTLGESVPSYVNIANIQCKMRFPIKILIQDHSQLFYLKCHYQFSTKKSKSSHYKNPQSFYYLCRGPLLSSLHLQIDLSLYTSSRSSLHPCFQSQSVLTSLPFYSKITPSALNNVH
jgi:hypothetical protein